MPVATSFIIAAGLELVGLTTAATWVAAHTTLVNIATMLIIQQLTNPDLPKLQDRSSTTPGRGSIAPWQYIYGTVRTPGVNTFVHVSGENNQFLNTVNILAAHKVEKIGQMYFNNEPIELDGNGDAVGRFVNNAHVDKKLGEINQTAITDLIDITKPYYTNRYVSQYTTASPNSRGIKFDGAYQYGESTSIVNNPNILSLGFSFKLGINRNITLIAIKGGWKVLWNDDYSISFVDASGVVINSGILSNPEKFHAQNIRVMISVSGTDINIFVDYDRNDQTSLFTGTIPSYNKGAATGKIYIASTEGTSNFFSGNIGDIAIWNVDKSAYFYHSIGITLSPLFGAMHNVAIGGWPSEPDYSDVEVAWTLGEASGNSIDNSVSSGSNDLIIKGAWTLAHTLNSRSYVRTLLTWDVELFSKGVPPQAFDVKGKLVPDFVNVKTVSSVDVGTNILTSVGHGFTDGEVVEIYSISGLVPAPLTTFVEYYVEEIDSNDFKLHSIPYASGAAEIDLTDVGSGTIKIIQRLWSANAARCTMDYLHDPFIGMRIDFSEFDESSWIAAIGICDEAVPRTNDPDEARYEVNGILSSSKTPKENIQSLLTAMGGTLVYIGDRWFVYASAWRAPAITLDEDDFVSSMDIQSLVPRRENFNAVRGIFVYPNANWEPTDFPPITSSVFEEEDGGERVYTDITLPFTTSYSAAQRLAKIVLFKQRETINLRVTAKLSAFQAQPGDVIKINNDRMGWTDKEFEVLSGQLKVDAEKGIVYSLVLRETNSGVYSWLTEESEIGFLNNTALPDASQIIPPFISLSSGTPTLFKRADGTIHSRIKISITCADPYVNNGGRYEIQFKKTSISASIWEQFGSVPGDSTEAFLLDVEDGDSYDVRVRSINTAGLVSGWIEELNHIVVGKTELPSDVINFSVTQSKGLVTFLWTENTDTDLAGYVIRYHVQGTPIWSSGILLTDTVRTNSFITDKIPAGSWTMMIKARDTSKNLSENEASFDIVVSQSNVIISNIEESPLFGGTLVNFVRHVSNVLIPQGTKLVSDYTGFIGQVSGIEFTKFCPDAFATSTYTADEIVLNTSSTVLLNSTIIANVGPDETGEVLPQMQVNIDPDGTGYTGWVNFSPGDYIVKRVQFRVIFTNDEESRAVFTGMSTIVDEEPVSQTQQGVVIANPVTTIIFAIELNTIPIVTPIVKGSTALFPSVDNVTTAQADIHLYDAAGNPAAGVVDININTSAESL